MLTNTGEIWERHRKIVEPLFHFTELEKYLGVFNDEANLLSENLAAKGGVEFNMHRTLCMAVLRIVAFAIGGMDFDSVEPDRRKQEQLVSEIILYLKIYSAILFRPWKAFDGFMWMTADGRNLKRIIGFVRDVTGRYLAALRAFKHKRRTHFNSLVLEENPEKPGTTVNLRDEIMTLAMSGTETTAGAMGYTLCLLGLYPEWQEAARRQLDQVFGSGGDYLRPATTEDLAQLTVIDAVIKESLRLFPTLPVLPRILHEDIQLAGGRYVAPRGCCVFVTAFATQRHPELYQDPDKFDPSRFLPGASATVRKSSNYLPFGSGSRRCLGGQFAIMEMKVLLAMILRRLTILPGSSREELETILLSLTSHPVTGFKASFVPRELQIPSKVSEGTTEGISTQ